MKANAGPAAEGEEVVQIMGRFPKPLADRLRTAAAERHLSANYLINVAVTELLDNLIPVDELKFTRPKPAPRPPLLPGLIAAPASPSSTAPADPSGTTARTDDGEGM